MKNMFFLMYEILLVCDCEFLYGVIWEWYFYILMNIIYILFNVIGINRWWLGVNL